VKKRLDNTLIGLIIGIVAPVISFFIILKYVYPFQFDDHTLHSLWLHMVAPKVISLGAIPNLGFFFLFIYTNRLRSARGVLGATMLVAILVFILKLVQ
jgi:hypothetical protein